MKRPDVQRLRMVGVRDVRDINQTMFLHLIRERQPVSRAELAKATGLRAGTVSAIVNRLLEERLIYEGVAGPSSGGRPPTYLYINAENAGAARRRAGTRSGARDAGTDVHGVRERESILPKSPGSVDPWGS
jgi:hypothetical protein